MRDRPKRHTIAADLRVRDFHRKTRKRRSSGDKNWDRVGGLTRGTFALRVVSALGNCREPLLQLAEGVP